MLHCLVTAVRTTARSFWPRTATGVGLYMTLSAALLAGANGGYYETVPFSGREHLSFIPHRIDRLILGRFNWAEHWWSGRPMPRPDHPAAARIREIVGPIFAATERVLGCQGAVELKRARTDIVRGMAWEVLVADTSHAWPSFGATPRPITCQFGGGRILVRVDRTKDAMVDEEVLAMKVANEIGRMVARVNSEWWSHFLYYVPLFILVGGMLGFRAAATCPLGVLIAFTKALHSTDEYDHDTDLIGMMLMASSGYDPHTIPEFYLKRMHIFNRENRAKYLSRGEHMKMAITRYEEAHLLGTGRTRE